MGDDLTITKTQYENLLTLVAEGKNTEAYIALQRLDKETTEAYERFD